MNRDIVIAKVRRWQAELAEMIVELKDQGKGDGKLAKILVKRQGEIDDFINVISDKSFIPHGDVEFEPEAVADEIDAKVKKVIDGVQRIKRLSKEKREIIRELEE